MTSMWPETCVWVWSAMMCGWMVDEHVAGDLCVGVTCNDAGMDG